MHYGEHAILAHYMTILIFFFLGIMFLILFPQVKERSRLLGTIALSSGIITVLSSLYLIVLTFIESGDGILRLLTIVNFKLY